MTPQGAERAVITSAVVVAGVYAYRALAEGTSSSSATIAGYAGQTRPVPPLGSWATAWGFTFMVVALLATVSAELGGGFAVLIATADLLSNGQNLIDDITGGATKTASATAPAASPTRKPRAAAASGISSISDGVKVVSG